MNNFFLPVFFLTHLMVNSLPADKIWLYSTDIQDAKNWDNASCKSSSLEFPYQIPFTYIYELAVGEVVLPNDGVVYLTDGAYIELNPHVNICISILDMTYHSWFDPNSWDYENNIARPNAEKIPCRNDNVIFPYGLNSAILFDFDVDITVKNVGFAGVYATPEQMQVFFHTANNFLQKNTNEQFFISPKGCEDPTGCACHGRRESAIVCEGLRKRVVWDEVEGSCLEPIEPIGHCSQRKMCGATVIFEYQERFRFQEFEKSVPEVGGVAAYMSKVWFGDQELIQVVFADEGTYEGRSVDVARDLFNKISEGDFQKKNGLKNVQLAASGPPYVFGQERKTMVWVIFGTLLMVLTTFSTIFGYYMGPLRNLLSKWLPSTRTGASVPYSSIKYSTGDNDSVAFGERSMAGSILSLEKSFENPMYQHGSTSTSSTTLEEKKEHAHDYENPMYEMSLKKLAVEEEKVEE